MKKTLLAIFLICIGQSVFAQKGIIKGRIYNSKTNEPIEFASILIQGTTIGSTSDLDGNFIFTGINPGFVRLVASFVGFETAVSPEIQVQGNQTAFIDIGLTESALSLDEVVIRPNFNIKRIESPVSVLTLGVQEIEKSAGVNRDVSKAMQTLPGVGATDPNRNDLIVRGGGPSENVFYLDGIEIPVINHFSTQGSSGGVVGIVNPDFVREISFYTGAFPANRTNALSSAMEIRLKDGSKDRVHTKLSVGASDAALTVDGPIGRKSTFIVSARQSYLQYLFKAIGLPFLPTYNDFQVKYKYNINDKNELSFIGIGAVDNMTLNTVLQENGTEAQRYVLGYLPIYNQWNYTVGAVYKHFGSSCLDTWALSRNMLRNKNFKYLNNDESKPKTFDYLSDEAENKLRFERTYTQLPVKLLFGGGVEYARYTNSTSAQVYANGTVNQIDYNTELNLFGYQAFAQVSDEYFKNRLKLSLGVSAVGNNFNQNMKNPLNQISPRFSASFALSENWDINANFGRYAMRPAYTSLGFKNVAGEYANRNESVKYIFSNQAIMGLEFRPKNNVRMTLEGFYKQYENYPVSVIEGISLASKGTEYGQVGDEKIISNGKGRAYGFEFYSKITDLKNLNISMTYTFFRSEFTDSEGVYRSSSWDTRHLLNLLSSYKFPKNWNISARWRFVGGAPYTPVDMDLSTNKAAWNITNQAYLDYTRFNSLRLPNAHQLDMRIDKEFYFSKWLLNLYADVQNVYNFQSKNAPIYTNLDANGAVMDDPADPENRQKIRIIDAYSGTILPTVGIIVKF